MQASTAAAASQKSRLGRWPGARCRARAAAARRRVPGRRRRNRRPPAADVGARGARVEGSQDGHQALGFPQIAEDSEDETRPAAMPNCCAQAQDARRRAACAGGANRCGISTTRGPRARAARTMRPPRRVVHHHGARAFGDAAQHGVLEVARVAAGAGAARATARARGRDSTRRSCRRTRRCRRLGPSCRGRSGAARRRAAPPRRARSSARR